MAVEVIDWQPADLTTVVDTANAWTDWPTLATQTITTLSGSVLVDVSVGGTYYMDGEGIALRLGISFDGGSTYDYNTTATTGYQVWTQLYGLSATLRQRVSLRHTATGTLSGDLIVKLQYLTQNASDTDIVLTDVRGYARTV